MYDKIEQFAELIRRSERIVFFGGAGVSTESGLRDYRSEDGIYNAVMDYGCPPEEILSRSFFYRDPDTFYRFYRDFFLDDASPNRAHYALAELERRGKLLAVITQNVDGLHQAAGSSRVFELHGTTDRYYCLRCGESYGKGYIRDCEGVPRCECGGLIRPEVTLYEERLNAQTVDMAIEAISRADMLIVGGTSLAVYPAAGFLDYFRGERLVVINKEPTPCDEEAGLVFHDSIGRVLESVVERL